MNIKLAHAEQESEFIRHARTETLLSVGLEPTPETVEPSPWALYFIAYDSATGRPVALAEVSFHDQVYASFEQSPYAGMCDLGQFCAFPNMCGIRTIYVEPDHRRKAGSIYMRLILAGARVCDELGARFATASTTSSAADRELGRLYERTGGRALCKDRMEGYTESETVVFVFEVKALLAHPLADRVLASAEIDTDMGIARELRSRSRWDAENDRRCA